MFLVIYFYQHSCNALQLPCGLYQLFSQILCRILILGRLVSGFRGQISTFHVYKQHQIEPHSCAHIVIIHMNDCFHLSRLSHIFLKALITTDSQTILLLEFSPPMFEARKYCKSGTNTQLDPCGRCFIFFQRIHQLLTFSFSLNQSIKIFAISHQPFFCHSNTLRLFHRIGISSLLNENEMHQTNILRWKLSAEGVNLYRQYISH